MSEPSRIVKTIASIIFPPTMVFGIYVILHGHLTPGGGFQGGAVVASAITLLLVAFGTAEIARRLKESHLSMIESIGALGFISLALLGLTATFFYNFLAGSGFIFGRIPPFGSNPGDMNTAGTLPLMNISVGLKVIAGLFAVVLVLAFVARSKGGGKR